MSIRKRAWKTSKGEAKEAWIVDYVDGGGRHIETFAKKKDADARHAVVKVDISTGVHGASKLTVAEAGATGTFNYIFFRGDTGEKLFSSWGEGPASVVLAPDGSIDGLIEGIVGMKTGGRRQVTIPASMVFGGEGNEGMGLPAGVDLVMVADLLATY